MYEIIVNPGAKSGRGVKLWSKVEPLFIDAGVKYNVHFTERFEEGGSIVQDIYAAIGRGRSIFIWS